MSHTLLKASLASLLTLMALNAVAQSEGSTAPSVEPRLVISLETLLQYRYNVPRNSFADQVRLEDPFGVLTMELTQDERLGFRVQATVQREWPDSESVLNIPGPVDGNPVRFENNLVTEGVLLLPIGPAQLTFGRQKIHIGPDATDSLTASQLIPYYDAILLEVPVGSLLMTSVTSTIENRRASPDATSMTRDGYAFGENIIFYNIHYFSYEWERVRAGIGSQVVLARPHNNFQLGDFFPVFSWHNAEVEPFNMSLVADASVSLFPGLEAYLQIGYDDIDAETFGFNDSAVPTIDAYLGGVSYALNKEISARLQIGYTHYLWGMFDDDEFLARAIYRWYGDAGSESMPLKGPWGPGALWFQIDGELLFGDLLIEPEVRFLGTKPVDLYSTSYRKSQSVEDASRTWANFAGAEATYRFGELAAVSVRPGFWFGSDGASFGLEAHARFSVRYEG